MKYHITHPHLPTMTNSKDTISLTLEDFYKLDNNTIEYIDLHSILEHVDINKFLPILNSKLRLKGICVIVGGDIDKICEFYLDKYISYEEFSNMVFNKKLYPLDHIADAIKNYFTIDSIKTDKVLYYIEFRRKLNDKN